MLLESEDFNNFISALFCRTNSNEELLYTLRCLYNNDPHTLLEHEALLMNYNFKLSNWYMYLRNIIRKLNKGGQNEQNKNLLFQKDKFTVIKCTD